MSYVLVLRKKKAPAKQQQFAHFVGMVSFSDVTPAGTLKGDVIRRCMEIKRHGTRGCMVYARLTAESYTGMKGQGTRRCMVYARLTAESYTGITGQGTRSAWRTREKML